MSDDFYNLVNQKSSAGIKILPTIETMKRLVALLNPKTDLLVALTHQGVDEDSNSGDELPGFRFDCRRTFTHTFETSEKSERYTHRANRIEL